MKYTKADIWLAAGLGYLIGAIVTAIVAACQDVFVTA